MDPLVRVELHGVTADNASKQTFYIENNGEEASPHTVAYPVSRVTGNKTITSTLTHRRIQPDVERELRV